MNISRHEARGATNFKTLTLTCACWIFLPRHPNSNMADSDSDSSSSLSDSTDISTSVLLGYASKEPTVDDFSQLGGLPVRRQLLIP